MVLFPNHLEPYREKALSSFLSGIRPDMMLFSRSTYQCFFDDKESVATHGPQWVFVQLDPSGIPGDMFCSCSDCLAEQSVLRSDAGVHPAGCIHMALSFLTIFFSTRSSKQGVQLCERALPLHQKFYERSFFHALFFSLVEGHYASLGKRKKKGQILVSDWAMKDLMKQGKGGSSESQLSFLEGDVSCSWDGSNDFLAYCRRGFDAAFQDEVEETSIKLSNLSEEELAGWMDGTPTPELAYELSFLSELAKALFLYEERAIAASSKIPHQELLTLRWTFDEKKKKVDIEALFGSHFSLSALGIPYTSLERILKALSWRGRSIDAGPRVEGESIDAYRLHVAREKDGRLRPVLFYQREEFPKSARENIVGNWFFDKKQGCIREKKSTLAREERIEDPERIEAILDACCEQFMLDPIECESVFQKIHIDPVRRRLEVASYVEGACSSLDLDKDLLWSGRWAILPRTSERLSEDYSLSQVPLVRLSTLTPFPLLTTEIAAEDVPEMLLQHDLWLMKQPGFQLHSFSSHTRLTFQVDPKTHALTFRLEERTKHQNVKKKNEKQSCRFGKWTWTEGEGFFLEEAAERNFRHEMPDGVSLNAPIPPHRLSQFLQAQMSVLATIPGFFCPENPVTAITIAFGFDQGQKKVEINIGYKLSEKCSDSHIYLYEDYGYLEGHGFFQLPKVMGHERLSKEISDKDPDLWNAFFLEILPRLEREYECIVDPRLIKAPDLELHCAETSSKPEENEWDVSLFWKSSLGKVFLPELLEASRKAVRFVVTDAGLFDLSDVKFLWVHDVQRKQKKSKEAGPTRMLFRSYDFLRIQAHDCIHLSPVSSGQSASLQRLLEAKAGIRPSLAYLQSTLRPYQQHGLEWLWFLYTSGLSGLLCDDMGVGKTHQAMALLAAAFARHVEQGKPTGSIRFLIVCPTSLVSHWEEKLKKFLPDLCLFSYFGADRSKEDFSKSWNIFLTTYGIWRNEVSGLRHIRFDIAIFDELQVAKNHVSLIWGALAKVQASTRLGLTGTPIENQLRELKALFDLVLPGYFPDNTLFREMYIRPIERGEDRERRELLAKTVRPFVLRRKKEDVLPELPAKTEDIFLSELLGEQKALYQQVAALQGLPLIRRVQDEMQTIPYLHIFALLSALKQIANHPACYLKDVENYKQYESGKWQLFQELIEEALEGGQKVVVFSQYLNMLDIMALYLQELGVDYVEMRGRTKLRGKAIADFQTNPSKLVFLGSLQAAGLGIDLTAASIVIHYDRWWNAARENQATDRVYRIGQSRGVQVMKMITKGTVEEQIDKMIARKSSLLQDVLQYDDHQIVKKLTRQEILEVLEGIQSSTISLSGP